MIAHLIDLALADELAGGSSTIGPSSQHLHMRYWRYLRVWHHLDSVCNQHQSCMHSYNMHACVLQKS